VSAEPLALSPSNRAQLDRLGDILIPARDPMPSVSESDPDGRWLDRAWQARPDMARAVQDLLAAHPDLGSLEAIAGIEAEDAVGVAGLLMITAGRYYMNPAIRDLIGYPGQGGRDSSLPVYGWDRAADMLERVVQRGRVDRELP
jgi:hypothetical protein